MIPRIERERAHLDIPSYIDKHHRGTITYVDLARRAGISIPTMNRFVYDLPLRLDLDKLDRICNVLGSQPGEILLTHDEWMRRRGLKGGRG